jgi:hypothetical protein
MLPTYNMGVAYLGLASMRTTIQPTIATSSPQGVHCSSTINVHVRAQKGYYLEQACTKCTYKRHIAIKQEVDIHEVGDKAIEKYM